MSGWVCGCEHLRIKGSFYVKWGNNISVLSGKWAQGNESLGGGMEPIVFKLIRFLYFCLEALFSSPSVQLIFWMVCLCMVIDYCFVFVAVNE